MTLWEAALCGAVQGLTEFLPISSSGHLALLHALCGGEAMEGTLAFDVFLHLGTLTVVLCVLCRELFSLIPAIFSALYKLLLGKRSLAAYTEAERMALLLLVATAPMGLALLWKEPLEIFSQNVRLVGLLLVGNGCMLLACDRFCAHHARKQELSVPGALGVGIFQLCATLPGISRSGSTISGGMLFGLSREKAVRFSFLLSVPAILGASATELPDVLRAPISRGELSCALIGFACAVIFGFLAMRALLFIAKKEKFGIFAYYCMGIGLAASIFAC